MMTLPEQQLAFDADAVQRLLSISRATYYRLVTSGELRSFRIGRSLRVSRDAIEEFIARNESAAGRGDVA